MRMSKAALVIGSLFILALSPAAYARKDEIYTARGNNLAVGGYDAVSYFDAHQPQKGSADYSTEYKGATWNFVSKAHLQTFLADPEHYAPQYGGHCAWAAAAGTAAKGDPKSWNIVNDKLYLNYSPRIQKRWEKDIPGFIHDGDANWPDVVLSED